MNKVNDFDNLVESKVKSKIYFKGGKDDDK